MQLYCLLLVLFCNTLSQYLISVTFDDIEKSIRYNELTKTKNYLVNTFLSAQECYALVKIIAITGDSKEHIRLIKKLYTHTGTLSLKKNTSSSQKLTPLQEGELIIAHEREVDENKSDIGYALVHNHPAVFSFLMKAPHKKFIENMGCNLLQSAVILTRTEIIKELLKYDISLDCKVGINENSIWHTIATVDSPNINEIFDIIKNYYEMKTEKKVDLEINNNNKETPLMSACGIACPNLRIQIIEYLIKHGSKLNVIDIYGNTPLHRAILWNCIETIKVLLQNDIDYNVPDKKNNTALHTACDYLRKNIIIVLLQQKNILINAQNNDDETPLHMLLEKTNLNYFDHFLLQDIITLLYKAGASWDIYNKKD